MQPKDFFAISKRARLFGLASLAVSALSTAWFAMCFTAREQACWNNIHWFVLFYTIAVILALPAIRSTVGTAAFVAALLLLGVVSILAF